MIVDFLVREWLLSVSVALCLLTTLLRGAIPAWSVDEGQVLMVLAALFIAVKGVEKSGTMTWVARRVERGRLISLKLVVATFILSMFVTNDAALVVMVPLTLALDVARRDILVILEALAANAGSALTPFGNPQNLFIYWHYSLNPWEFVGVISPFVIFFFVVFAAAALLLKIEPANAKKTPSDLSDTAPSVDAPVSFFYLFMLLLVILTVLHILPVWANIVVIAYVALFDKAALKIDYGLLAAFFFFFGIADNLATMFAAQMQQSSHIFLISAGASQFMSNVPAAVVMAEFTADWKALLWGTSVGGFGSLVGSLANLIAYRFYLKSENVQDGRAFTVRFIIAGYAAFGAGVALYLMTTGGRV